MHRFWKVLECSRRFQTVPEGSGRIGSKGCGGCPSRGEETGRRRRRRIFSPFLREARWPCGGGGGGGGLRVVDISGCRFLSFRALAHLPPTVTHLFAKASPPPPPSRVLARVRACTCTCARLRAGRAQASACMRVRARSVRACVRVGYSACVLDPGHMPVMCWSRAGHAPVKRRSRADHVPVTRRSRADHGGILPAHGGECCPHTSE